MQTLPTPTGYYKTNLIYKENVKKNLRNLRNNYILLDKKKKKKFDTPSGKNKNCHHINLEPNTAIIRFID